MALTEKQKNCPLHNTLPNGEPLKEMVTGSGTDLRIVEDAFDAKLHSSEHPMIIRHPLNFTSLFYGAAESASLRNENHMMDNDFLIDINSDDIEPKHAKLKENLLAMFRGTIYGIALISIFNFIYQIFF